MANLRADNLTGTGGRNAIDGSVFFDGNSYLMCSDSDAWDFGSGDFTIEYWYYEATTSNTERRTAYLYGTGSGSGDNAALILGHTNDNDGQLFFMSHDSSQSAISGSNVLTSSGSNPNGDRDNGWRHLAVVRDGSNLKIYLDGILEVTDTGYSTTAIRSDQNNWWVGHDPATAGRNFQGYISNYRVVKGTAVYTAEFTPSTEKLKAIDGTVLLCCQDSDNPTQEATGKELVGFGNLYYGKRYSNIATNGDLETGTTTGWTNNGCATFEVSTFSHSGSYSLHCVSDGNGDAVTYPITLNTSHRYKISAYINCVGPAGTSAKAKMKIGSGVAGSDNYESQTANVGNGWVYVEWIGKATNSTTTITFNESSSNNVNDWYVDDLRVELWYPEETENILANPNFLDDATGWSFSSTPSGEYTISSNRLNVADNSRTSDAYATQQIHHTSAALGRYRIQVDYSMSSGGFDVGIGNNRIWSISGTSSNTWEIDAGSANSSFRLITNQHGVGHFNSIKLYRIAPPKQTNNPVPSGIDEGVTFNGDTKINSKNYMYFPTGDTSQRGRGRGLYGGGAIDASTSPATIAYINIQSQGNTTTFGELTQSSRCWIKGMGSSTRSIFAGGCGSPGSPVQNVIDYVTIATTSNATDFGDMTFAGFSRGSQSNNTRGIIAGGNPSTNVIEYITIASTGDAADFGDLTDGRRGIGSMGSPTRAVWAGGVGSPANVDTMDYSTIASTGDATDFGNLLAAGRFDSNGASSSTRGIIAGGNTGSDVNTIQYITIASTGDATDFGDLQQVQEAPGSLDNSIRGVFSGSYQNPTSHNTMNFITIATTGNATDFGDNTASNYGAGGTSDSHGGI